MKTIKLITILGLALLFGCSNAKPVNADATEDKSQLDRKWWKEDVIYQIYPRSFKDSNGDGIGDLRGIIQELDYIKSLGIDMVWLNPIYSSPNFDNGYDISDYRNIMTDFGTMADFDAMVKGMHDRGIKFVMDVVVNHSSDEHEWFKQSRSSRDNPYRDYYHWWPAEKGKPPHRFSFFDEKADAWEYDEKTNAYYLHYFGDKQPDLNWENPKVRQEIYDMMKFWAEKGVDGFRLDAFQYVSKDITWPTYEEGYEKDIMKVVGYYGMGPHLHQYLQEMHDQVFSKYNVFSVSEGVGTTLEHAHSLVDPERKELNMAYHFEGVDIAKYKGWDFLYFKNNFTKWAESFEHKGWIAIFLANHDSARMVSRFGNDSPAFRAPSSKMLNTFLLSMKGTPYTYYGDELGMTSMHFDSIDQFRDIAAINAYKFAKASGRDMDDFMKELNFMSRDKGRTPMQWDDSKNANFTTGTPWLPVNPNHVKINVEAENADKDSCLNYFRKMVQLRKDNLILVYGDYDLLLPEDKQIFAYTRTLGDDRWLVLLNFSTTEAVAALPNEFSPGDIKINNYDTVSVDGSTVTLKPYQAVIFALK